MRHLPSVLLVFALCQAVPAGAADQWIEVKSPHFTITSNAGKGRTATVAWQLEQVRAEVVLLWPWAKVDLNKPLVVFALKDEQSLKKLAPQFWEKKNNGGAATVWVGGRDATFLALRTDVEQDAKRHVNPYASSYFAYFSLILQQSMPRHLPPWFARGLAAVMSNTVIDGGKILVGPPATWYLDEIHRGRRMSLTELVAARDGSPLLTGDNLFPFDAQAWALVHFLMFANDGARWPQLGKYSEMVFDGTDPDVAFQETIGRAEDLEGSIRAYVDRNLFSYKFLNADASVNLDHFAVAPLPPAEAAARRALFQVAMGRPVEARVAIDEARKAGGAADADTAEAILLDDEDKTDAARDAYVRATAAGTSDPYAYLPSRVAALDARRRQADPHADGLAAHEGDLAQHSLRGGLRFPRADRGRSRRRPPVVARPARRFT